MHSIDIVIPTKNRQLTISTHRARAFRDHRVWVLVHNTAQERSYLEHNPDLRGKILVTDTLADRFGLTRQREWWCEHQSSGWFCFADDNIEEVTGLVGLQSRATQLPVQENERWRNGDIINWKNEFAHVFDSVEFMELFTKDTMQAQALKFKMVSFATTNNHYFRGRHYRRVGYGIGKMMFWLIDHDFKWDHTISMEDFRNTAEHLYQYGGILIDNYVFPECTHYQPGGMGTYAERVPQRQVDVKRLMKQYPNLFRVKNRKGFVENTDLAVRLTTPSQVEAWRLRMSELRR